MRFILSSSLAVLFVFLGVATALLEKIFNHADDRDEQFPELKKLARIDFENDDLRRALQELRNSVPQYTGYFLLDLISEIVKNIFVFVARIFVPVEIESVPGNKITT